MQLSIDPSKLKVFWYPLNGSVSIFGMHFLPSKSPLFYTIKKLIQFSSGLVSTVIRIVQTRSNFGR